MNAPVASPAGFYRVTAARQVMLETASVKEAYGRVGFLMAARILVRGSELKIVYVSPSGREDTVSLNWVHQ